MSQIDADLRRRRAWGGGDVGGKGGLYFYPPFRDGSAGDGSAAVADGRRMRPAGEPLEDPWDKVPYDPRKLNWRR